MEDGEKKGVEGDWVFKNCEVAIPNLSVTGDLGYSREINFCLVSATGILGFLSLMAEHVHD